MIYLKEEFNFLQYIFNLIIIHLSFLIIIKNILRITIEILLVL